MVKIANLVLSGLPKTLGGLLGVKMVSSKFRETPHRVVRELAVSSSRLFILLFEF
jgi:hypothetical protein